MTDLIMAHSNFGTQNRPKIAFDLTDFEDVEAIRRKVTLEVEAQECAKQTSTQARLRGKGKRSNERAGGDMRAEVWEQEEEMTGGEEEEEGERDKQKKAQAKLKRKKMVTREKIRRLKAREEEEEKNKEGGAEEEQEEEQEEEEGRSRSKNPKLIIEVT